MYQKDSNKFSLLWGRIGAAVLLLVSVALGYFGYEFAEEDQKAIFEAISTILGCGSLIQIVSSKVRESKKVKQAKIDKIKEG